MNNYEAWICGYCAGVRIIRGRCWETCQKMRTIFPELELRRGYIKDKNNSAYPHWWLVDPCGGIVDPTASQFDYGIEEYRELADGDPVKYGVCMDCAEPLYTVYTKGAEQLSLPTFCGELCHKRFASSL